MMHVHVRDAGVLLHMDLIYQILTALGIYTSPLMMHAPQDKRLHLALSTIPKFEQLSHHLIPISSR